MTSKYINTTSPSAYLAQATPTPATLGTLHCSCRPAPHPPLYSFLPLTFPRSSHTHHYPALSLPMASMATSVISTPRAVRSGSLRQALPLRSKSISFVSFQHLPSFQLHSAGRRFQVTCAAKPETVEKVCNIVKKQLALEEGQVVTGESTFSGLGADSLDTVEIVMGLEEEFGISVEEESAQNIATVQDAADLIEKLCEKN